MRVKTRQRPVTCAVTPCHSLGAWKRVTLVRHIFGEVVGGRCRTQHTQQTQGIVLFSAIIYDLPRGVHRAMLTSLLFLVALLSLSAQRVNAQIVVNGQIFTYGLAIVDAPQPGT